MARNTTIIRSNYLWDESARIYEHALKLWEGLEEDLDYPILFHSAVCSTSRTACRTCATACGAWRPTSSTASTPNGSNPKRSKSCARSSTSPTTFAIPCWAATYQPRAGIAKHDWVAWGFARRANEAGIDIIQNCEVTGFGTDGSGSPVSQTTRGDIAAGRVALCAAGHTSILAEMLGIRAPMQSHPLQALVSELLEPVHPTVVMSNAVHVYVSQAHKGELVMGAGVDSYNG